MTCSTRLREEGKLYPRTCAEHGLYTPCPPVNDVVVVIPGGFFTVADVIRELSLFDPNKRVNLASLADTPSRDVAAVEQDDVDPDVVNIVG